MSDTYTAAEIRLLVQIVATLDPDDFDPEEVRAVIYKAKSTIRRANDEGGVIVKIYGEP